MKYLKVFSDFAEAIETLSDAEAGRLFRAMLLYAKTDEEPSIVGNERFIWPIAKMNIDRQRDEYKTKCSINQENGKKGGRPKPKETQENRLGFSETQNNPEEPKKSQDKDKDKDKDKEYIPPLSPTRGKEEKPDVAELFGYNKFLLEAVNDWLAYKQEQRKPYKPVGLRNLLSAIQKKVSEYGEDAVVGVIRDSMSANYQGIVWDWLNRKSWNNNQSRKTNNIFLEMYEEEYGQTANNEDPFGS